MEKRMARERRGEGRRQVVTFIPRQESIVVNVFIDAVLTHNTAVVVGLISLSLSSPFLLVGLHQDESLLITCKPTTYIYVMEQDPEL